MKIRKIVIILMMLVLLVGHSFAEYIPEEIEESITLSEIEEIVQTSAVPSSDAPEILSRSAVIFDRESGEVIWGKNENEKMAMASTTKILTAIVVIEHGNLNEVVEVESKAAAMGGSRLGLRTGDKITMNDLLYGLMLKSRK